MQTTINQQGQRFRSDVIVIGGGIAGLSYILELCTIKPNLHIKLLIKGDLTHSNTNYAQGGIAAANEEDIQQHITDTLIAGDGLCHLTAVESILRQGQESIHYLLERGVPFDRDNNSELACGQEAGHSKRRIYHVGDQTGEAIITALLKKIRALPNVTILEQHIAINLITQCKVHQPACFPEVVGVYVLDEKTKLIHTILANVVVLATGGAGKVYRYTSNPSVATGDGVAMAYRAGARVSGLEFYQFHPTLLYHPDINNFLISEALRGEGAYLRSPDNGERFMQHHAPTQMELSTRDIVSKAIFTQIEHSNYDYVHLDIRHKNKHFLQQRFPKIYRTLASIGLDLNRDLIPVVPGAHYMGGGIVCDTYGRTDLTRLYAIGETAFTGLHGANRLASNSLLEGIVMGRNAAKACLQNLAHPILVENPIHDWDSTSVIDLRRASQIKAHWHGLRSEMSSYAGIVRTEKGLRDQLHLVLTRRKMIEEYYWHHLITRDVIELRNIILIAELIVRSALTRRESRGGHYREDFSTKAPNLFESTLNTHDATRIGDYDNELF